MHTYSLQIIGKLKKWDTVDEVHRTIDIPEAPKVGSSGKIKVDKSGIPLPPPPPPAHLLKQLHVDTKHSKKDNEQHSGGSPISSFYSPGNDEFDIQKKCPTYIILFEYTVSRYECLIFRWFFARSASTASSSYQTIANR